MKILTKYEIKKNRFKKAIKQTVIQTDKNGPPPKKNEIKDNSTQK